MRMHPYFFRTIFKLSTMCLEIAWDLESENLCLFPVLSFDPGSSSLKCSYEDLLLSLSGGQNEIMRATLPGTQPGARKPFPGAILTLSTIAKAVWEQNGDLLTQAWMLSAPATERTRHRLVVGRTTSTVKNRRAPAFSLCIWLLDWTPCLNTLPPKINNSNVNNDRWLLLSTYYMPGTILSACMCYLI